MWAFNRTSNRSKTKDTSERMIYVVYYVLHALTILYQHKWMIFKHLREKDCNMIHKTWSMWCTHMNHLNKVFEKV